MVYPAYPSTSAVGGDPNFASYVAHDSYSAQFDASLAAQQSIYTPEAVDLATRQSAATTAKPSGGKQKPQARTTVIRKGGGETWEDPTLMEWDPTHFRLFVGDLANDVSDDLLRTSFSGPRFPSFVKAKVVREKTTGKSKGFGFVSYSDPEDFMKAWKEMNGKYVGSRPVKIKKATTQVGAVTIGARKARELDSKKKQPTSGKKKEFTSNFNVNNPQNKPYARR